MKRLLATFLPLVAAFLPSVLQAGVEELTFDGMVSAHVARLARRDGILPWTRHDAVTNDFGRVRLTGEDALAPGLYRLQLRDADGWLEARDAEGRLVREVAPANDRPTDWLWTLFGLSETECAKPYWRLSYLVSAWEVVPADYVESPEPASPSPRRRAPAAPSASAARFTSVSVSDHVITYVAEWDPALRPPDGVFDLYACIDLARPEWRRVASFSAAETTCHTGTVASASVPGWDAGRALVHDADCFAVTNVVAAPFGSGGAFTNATWSCDHRAVSAKPVFLRFGDRTDADLDGVPDCLAAWGGGPASEYGLYLAGRSQLWYLANYPGVLVSATAADGSPALVLADPAATNLYCTVCVVPGDAGPDLPIRIANGNGFAPDGAEFLLAADATNRIPLRIGQRYDFGDFWPGDWSVLSDDPSVVCATNLADCTLSVCRPFRVELTDLPPPDDAPRCSLGHVHRRYCSFATDPDVPGTLALFDTDCISVDNATRTLSVAQSWAPGHVSGSSLRERGATGAYVTSDGVAQVVLDDLCPHSLGGSPACRCGAAVYCPDCIGATAEWYNRTYGALLTATDAADGSVSVSWKEGVCPAAYYWVAVTAPERAATVTVTPEEPTALGGCSLTLVSGRSARIPFLAGVRYTVESRYAALSFAPEDADVAVANPSNRFYTVERPLSFSAVRAPEGETRCPEGHAHGRRYRIAPNVEGLEGRVSLQDASCFIPDGADGFTVRCTGEPGPACAPEGPVTGTFAYEGAVKSFALPDGICRCDDRRRPVCPCGEDSLCDGCDDTAYGQEAAWVRINFARLRAIDPTLANAEEILSTGYANWVRRTVGANAPNGLFRLDVAFDHDPEEIVRLSVGGCSVCVNAAGTYPFVLSKGARHEIEMSFVPEGTAFSYCDAFTDAAVPDSRRAARRTVGVPNIHTEITAFGSTEEVEIVVPSPSAPSGHITWTPYLRISPDHCLDPSFPILFHAFVDLPPWEYPSVRWSSDDGSISETGEWLNYDGSSPARDITVIASYRGTELTGRVSIRQLVSETRVALAAPSVIVVEDPYANRPDEVVMLTSSTARMTASWELAQAGRLCLESTDSMPTRVCVGDETTEIRSFPYEIGSFDRHENGSLDFYLTSTNMNATGNVGTYRLRFIPDEGAEHEASADVRIVKIRVEADANWPSNKVRHVFGPKELVHVRTVNSALNIQLTGSLPDHGQILASSSDFVVPDQPGAFTVNGTVDGFGFSIECTCIPPTHLRGESPRALTSTEWSMLRIPPFMTGEAGVIAHIETYLEPDFVSFGQLRLFEGVAPPRGREGWYLDVSLFPDSAIGHTTAAGASSDPTIEFFTIGSGNKTSNGDYIGSWIGAASSYSNGSYRLDIPVSWYTVGCSVTNRISDNVQTIWVYDNGSMRVNKNGVSWQRETNGSEYQP